MLAEPFIRGRELTTAVIDGEDGPRALGVTELVIETGFYAVDLFLFMGGSVSIIATTAFHPTEWTDRFFVC